EGAATAAQSLVLARGTRLAGARRGTSLPEALESWRSAAPGHRGNVRVRPAHARADVRAERWRSVQPGSQLRRLRRGCGQRRVLLLDHMAGLLATGASRRRARLWHQVSGVRRPAQHPGDDRRLRDRRGEEILMYWNLSHFEASFVFSVFTSIVFGVVTKRTDRERWYYGLYVFGCFLAATFGLGWLMYLGHG